MEKKLKELIGNLPKSDGAFKRRMRFHQGWWRSFVLNKEQGSHPLKEGDTVCSMIDDGNENFLTDNILKIVNQNLSNSSPGRSGIIEKERLFKNLLSSQPLCFNFFAELKIDRDLACCFVKNFIPVIDSVVDVYFEYAPGKPTGDSSAFDVAIEVKKNGEKGLFGLECKYTDTFSYKNRLSL